MADKTKIEWSNATWNFITGCEEVSPGCGLPRFEGDLPGGCYAKAFAERFRGVEGHYFEHGFDLQLRPEKLDLPLLWKRIRKIFVNSMSDLFHKDVPVWIIIHAFAVMALTPHHTYQILTKRHGRMRSLLSDPEFWVEVGRKARELRPSYANAATQLADGRRIDDPATWETIRSLPNVWLGVSVENQQWADIRIPALLETPAAVRFLSCEPLLGPVDLSGLVCPDCHGAGGWSGYSPMHGYDMDAECGGCGGRAKGAGLVDWVIAGGESGRYARLAELGWFTDLAAQCEQADTAFFMKQLGVVLAKQVGATGKGGDPAEWPISLPREFPEDL